jgi:nicotinamidase-related amidase
VPTPLHLDPSSTAIVTMEMQRGICGDLAAFPALRDLGVEVGIEQNAARLLDAARLAGARVVHCTYSMRADRVGSRVDIPVMAAARRDSNYLLQGTPSCELLPALGPAPTDIVNERHHGLTPFTGTDLDMMLRSMGIRTIVATGVSLNIGVPGLCVEAVDLGYDVVVATDAVVGIPRRFGEDVLAHTIAMYARLATVDEVIAAITG